MPDGTDTVSYSLDDDAGGRFAIDANTGVVTVAGGIDREAAASYDITVRATSTDTSSTTQTYTIAVGDVDEFDTGRRHRRGRRCQHGGRGCDRRHAVGVTGLATDADATDGVTYSLSDDAGGRFAIDANTGVVTVNGALDYEAATSHSVTILATSDDGSTQQPERLRSTSPTSTKVRLAPSVTPTARPTSSSRIGTGLSGGRDGLCGRSGRHRYGQLLAGRRCRRAVHDRRQHGRCDRRRRRSTARRRPATTSRSGPRRTDTSSTTQTYTIAIGDVDEFDTGAVTDSDGGANTVAEDAIVGTTVGLTGLATDADATDSVTYTPQRRRGRPVCHRRQHGPGDRQRRARLRGQHQPQRHDPGHQRRRKHVAARSSRST